MPSWDDFDFEIDSIVEYKGKPKPESLPPTHYLTLKVEQLKIIKNNFNDVIAGCIESFFLIRLSGQWQTNSSYQPDPDNWRKTGRSVFVTLNEDGSCQYREENTNYGTSCDVSGVSISEEYGNWRMINNTSIEIGGQGQKWFESDYGGQFNNDTYENITIIIPLEDLFRTYWAKHYKQSERRKRALHRIGPKYQNGIHIYV